MPTRTPSQQRARPAAVARRRARRARSCGGRRRWLSRVVDETHAAPRPPVVARQARVARRSPRRSIPMLRSRNVVRHLSIGVKWVQHGIETQGTLPPTCLARSVEPASTNLQCSLDPKTDRWRGPNGRRRREDRMSPNSRRGKFVVTALMTVAALIAGIATPLAGRAVAATPPADVVVEWNANAQAAIIGTAGQGPTVAYLHFAMVQGAVYDAVNAIEGGHEPYLGAPASADSGDSSAAAAAQAAHDVLVGLFPAQKATLDAKLATTLAGIPDGSAETGGIEVGAAAAAAMLL